MVQKQAKPAERRVRTQEAVQKLLAERSQMLALYWRAAGLGEGGPQSDVPDGEALQSFCQLLVDYVALGHFTVYDRIAAGEERRSRVMEAAGEVLPRLEETTQSILDFNELYKDTGGLDANKLSADLSLLGEHLALRAELEDRLLGELI